MDFSFSTYVEGFYFSRIIFLEYNEVLGNTFLEALWKERKTTVMNLNAGKKQARFDKLV